MQSIISSIEFEALSSGQKVLEIKSGERIYSNVSTRSTVVYSTTDITEAVILHVDNSYFVRVLVNGQDGYAPVPAFVDQNLISSLRNEYRARQQRSEPERVEPEVRINYDQQRALEAENRRKRFINNNPNLSASIRNQILNGQISIGMSREMAEASWGKPRDINRTVTSTMVREQWVYGTISNRRYLYFRNGILDSFQD